MPTGGDNGGDSCLSGTGAAGNWQLIAEFRADGVVGGYFAGVPLDEPRVILPLSPSLA